MNGDKHDLEDRIGDDTSDADAEGEEDDDQDMNAPVGAVKVPKDDETADESAAEEAIDDQSSASSRHSGSDESETSDESEEENEWEEESEGADDAVEEIRDSNLCIFCRQDEEHDPSEEFEEYLSCVVCGNNSHRQCARNENALVSNDDADKWRCLTCVENGLEADNDAMENSSTRRASAPQITRDLLPALRGSMNPDSHSMFNSLILDDDPMDGSRSLRKRKSSDVEPSSRPLRKRLRPSDDEASQNGDASTGAGSALSSRPRRTRKVAAPLAKIVHEGPASIIVALSLDPARMHKILSSRPRKRRTYNRPRRQRSPPFPEIEESHYPSIPLTLGPQLFSLHDRDMDDSKSKPYGGILNEAEADTSKTFPYTADRKKFEDARLKAEEDWKRKMTALYAGQEFQRPYHKPSATASKVKSINFGGYDIDTWHAAPYPEEYSKNKILYICEFCLKYMSSDYVAWRHKLKCPAKHPPGDEIYRDGRYSFFEVDGRKNPVYCQNLCLLAKLFLGSKTLYYDVEPFLFYIMTENDEYGCHFVGYFSKEKRPSSLNNVSCILVLPIFQRKGFGHMLIDFSYLLTRVEEKTGSPEKPLSDMGLVSYRNYWRLILCQHLMDQKAPLSITDIAERTGMTADDIISALEGLRALVRDPVTKTYALRIDYKYFQEYINKHEAKKWPKLNPDALVWVPYVMGRSNLAHYEDAPQMHTVAQREEEHEPAEFPEEGVQQQLARSTEPSHERDTNGIQDSPMDLTPYDDADRSLARTPSNGFDHPNGYSSMSPSRSQPGTPLPNGIHTEGSASFAIPPSRFEIFPPVPGTTTRRRPGRPFGSRRRTGTPVRRNSGKVMGVGSGGVFETPVMGGALRRTRSKLGEVVNGAGEEEGGEGKGRHAQVNGDGDGDGEQSGARAKEVNERNSDGEADAEGEDVTMEDAGQGVEEHD
ncbi:hypothetical protein P152DRAFT_397733 [Eremomyces bilateralis CBS 781.70]|uniref:Histone acetyltransferase n=1 Tax=Eremomyces bilateralis CBS 781.70 TaxID=1392243 RepID=A0A6G1G299_9PEZI|nr:uncharacterized protein P152DRAFT_397733 [Eremomyces bilateralis CBS 781.70]KAF1812237.1 hypothetical protein P152DRAFT_397733 [Eremomyces bilateralis CBS 781.70]